MKHKQKEENELRAFVASQPALRTKVGGAWDAIEKAQQVYRDIETQYSEIEHARAFAGRYFAYARQLVRGAEERAKPNADRLPEFADSRLPEVEQHLLSTAPIYPEYETMRLSWSLTKMRELLGADDPFVRLVLGKKSPEQLAKEWVSGTRLGDPEARRAMWNGGQDAVARSDDPFSKLALAVDPAARAIRKRYEGEGEAALQNTPGLTARARSPGEGPGACPAATFTLRLSYGEPVGWSDPGKEPPPFPNSAGPFARDTGSDPSAACHD